MDFELMRKRLIEAREMNGYNRKAFAAALGISYRTVTNYENGAREPGSDYITKVADFCKVSTDFILGRSDLPREEPEQKIPEEKVDRIVKLCEELNDAALDKIYAYISDLAFNPAYRK